MMAEQQVFHSRSTILVSCPKGLPPFLKEEIEALGFPVLAEKEAGVETEGTLADTLRLNLHLRTGHRVLFLLRDFRASTPEELYDRLVEAPWEDFIAADGYVSVDVAVQNETIRDPRFASLRCKDAIVDRIRRERGRRPDSGPPGRGVEVFLYWKGSRASVYLNTSGAPLSRRGYRKIPLQAPMQETLAAAVIRATGWKGEGHFVNPMCGSGTLAIEAALIGLGRAPGLLRSEYAFAYIRGFERATWQGLRDRARSAGRRTLPCRIVATDIRREAVEAAKKNAMTAGVDHLIEFGACDFAETPVPEGGGVVILNPEYGERMGDAAKLAGTYARIGDFFKQRCVGYRGCIFTGNLELAKKVGLRTKRRTTFFNSRIECRLMEYEIYTGTRRTFGDSR